MITKKLVFTVAPSEHILPGKTIYVTTPGNLPQNTSYLKTINRLNGEPVFDIGKMTYEN